MRRLGLVMALVVGLLAVEPGPAAVVLAQPQPQPAPPVTVTPSVAVDPTQAGATPHWTITIGAAYCGGYRIGDGVYLSPESPLALPQTVPDGSVLYSGQPASVVWVNGALRVSPGPGLVQSMICMAGQRPLNIELTQNAGFSLPADPGDYAVDVWTGADPTVNSLTFTVPATENAPDLAVD